MEKKIKGVFTRDNTYTILQYVQELENKIKLLNDSVNSLSDKVDFDKVAKFMDKFYEGAMSYMWFTLGIIPRFNVKCNVLFSGNLDIYKRINIRSDFIISDTKVNTNYLTKLNINELGTDEAGQPCFSMVDKLETTLSPSYTKDNFSIRYLSFGCRDQDAWDNGTPLLNIDADYLEPNLNGIEFDVNDTNPDTSYFKLSTSFTSSINRVCGRLLVFNSSNTLDRAFDLFLVKDGDACKLKLFDSADPSATSYTFPNGTRLVFTLTEMETHHL